MNDAVNPYAAPAAEVADVREDDAGVQPVKLFSLNGRLGRFRFMAYTFYAYLLYLIAMLVGGFIIGFMRLTGAPDVLDTVAGLALIPCFIFCMLIGIQRSHDMDWTGWAVLLTLIPFVGLIWVFKAGTPEPNRFGAPPPPNNLAIQIGAWLFPVLMVILFIAGVTGAASGR